MSSINKFSTDAEVDRQPFKEISGAIYPGVPQLIFFVFVEITAFVKIPCDRLSPKSVNLQAKGIRELTSSIAVGLLKWQ